MIDMDRAFDIETAVPMPRSDTVYLTVVDKDRWRCRSSTRSMTVRLRHRHARDGHRAAEAAAPAS
jgi:hypothetical protein